MPIKPENRHRYPADWQQIRARILARAGDRCERCGVPNHTWVHRLAACPERWVRANPLPVEAARLELRPSVRIVLTIAHYPDPEPENCDEGNLLALCQRCHNLLDAPLRWRHAAATRRRQQDAARAAWEQAGGQTRLELL